ncbi:M23 family metallopeptidase [Nonomuraea sp. JJY05]|uniref:M23 family metallopeptidase n=1 Tax=Nonomuraea sp. JJY05 TaxID=3350255 RepID=UPI00373EA6AB
MTSLPPTPAIHPSARTTALTPPGLPHHSTEPEIRHPIGASALSSLLQTPHPNRTRNTRRPRPATPPALNHHSPRPAQDATSSPAHHPLNPPREDRPPHGRHALTPRHEAAPPNARHAHTPTQEAATARAHTLRQEAAPPLTHHTPGHEAAPPSTRHALMAAQGALTTLLFAAAAILLLPATSARASPPTWRWPLDGIPRVLRPFAPPPEPWLAGHRGIDLAVPASTPVLAAGPGTVRFAGPVAGKGVVTIEHESGLRTTYLPVKASVRRGQPVAPGSTLGVVEASPGHCPESCLHWGLRRGTHYLDPLLLLGQASIRLLPFWPEDENPVSEHSLRDVDEHEHSLRPSDGKITRPLTTQPRRSSAALNFAPPTTPKALAATPAPLTLITRVSRSLPPGTSSQSRHDSAPSQRRPLSGAGPFTPISSRQKRHPPPSTTLGFLTRSASTTTTSAIGLGTLLGIGLLITALRSHRRTRTNHRLRRRGQHRATTGEEQEPENTSARDRHEKHPSPSRPTTTNTKAGRHRKTANDRN